MNACRVFLCFALFSFIGWAYESLYYTLQQKRLVNSGFLNGCCCPIYGIGGLLDIMLLGGIQNPVKLFFAGLLLTSSLEYFVSWLLEALFKKRWWDYTNWPLNINGRVCIIAGTAFGIMTVFQIKFIAPETFRAIAALPDNAVYVTAAIVAVLMMIDIIATIRNSDGFADKLWYVREQAKIFEDNGFGGRIMASVHPIKTIGRIRQNIHDHNDILELIRTFFRK